MCFLCTFYKYFIIKQFKYNCPHNLKIRYQKIEYHIPNIRFFQQNQIDRLRYLYLGGSMGTDIGAAKIPDSLCKVKDKEIICKQSRGSYFLKNLKDCSSRGGNYND